MHSRETPADELLPAASDRPSRPRVVPERSAPPTQLTLVDGAPGAYLGDAQFRLLVESVRDYAILSLLVDGTVASWNRGAEAIKGYRSEEIVGRHFSCFYTPADRDAGKPARLLREAAADGRVEDEGWRVRKDGSLFFADVVITALHSDGVLRGYAVVTRDISERHRTEAALAEANRELAQRSSDLLAIGEAVRAIAAASSDPRCEICVAIASITGATFVGLWEVQHGASVLTGAVGAAGPIDLEAAAPVACDAERAGVTRAFAARERVLVNDPQAESSSGDAMWATMAFQPVLQNGLPCAVLSLAWTDPLAALPGRMGTALDLLAAETAVIIDRAHLRKLLVDEARVDSVTGVANRRGWDEEAPRYIERARRDGHPLTLAMIDLDRFKDYNDRRGHQAGDRLLRATAQAWKGRIRGVDFLARYGGEEFALLLANCELDEAVKVCDALRAMPVDGVTCSVGVALWQQSESLSLLIGRADEALYEAKRTGRDRVLAAEA